MGVDGSEDRRGGRGKFAFGGGGASGSGYEGIGDGVDGMTLPHPRPYRVALSNIAASAPSGFVVSMPTFVVKPSWALGSIDEPWTPRGPMVSRNPRESKDL